jgi:hypothetical protein
MTAAAQNAPSLNGKPAAPKLQPMGIRWHGWRPPVVDEGRRDGRSNTSGKEERMRDKENAPHKTQQAVREPAAARNGRKEEAGQGLGERKPSKIERREWRGAGVCGDRHTD